MKSFIAFLATVFILVPFPGAGDTSNTKINIEISPGFEGVVGSEAWTPVNVYMESPPGPFTGMLTVTVPFGDLYEDSNPSGYSVSSKIFLTSRQTKNFVFTLPLTQSGAVKALVSDAAGEELYSQSKEISLFRNNRISILVAGGSADFDFLLRPGQPGSEIYNTLYVHPGMLPSEEAAFSASDMVILHDADLSSVSEARLNALASWVASGGVLVVTGSFDRRGDFNGLPEDLLPVDIIGPGFIPAENGEIVFRGLTLQDDAEEMILRTEAGVPVTSIAVKSTASLVTVSGNRPVAVSGRYGNGRVFYTGIDPGDPVFSTWNRKQDYWRSLFREAGTSTAYYPLENPLENLNNTMIPFTSDDNSLVSEGIFLILLPSVILSVIFLYRKITVKVLLFLTISGFTLWIILIIYLIPETVPSYLETGIIYSELNSDKGRYLSEVVTGSVFPSETGIHFNGAPVLLLPAASGRNIKVARNDGEISTVLYTEEGFPSGCYSEFSLHSGFSGKASFTDGRFRGEVSGRLVPFLGETVLVYDGGIVDRAVILREGNTLVLSFSVQPEMDQKDFGNGKMLNVLGNYLVDRGIADGKSVFVLSELKDSPVPSAASETENSRFLFSLIKLTPEGTEL